ncbi:nicotinate-nucleotide adenylyltransferase [Pseudoalteromonas sp. T1lg75]|uniref:nicotinate-nucleotide adenylyltransferase n=1 Tax=Pseudoalteromonas sp. T1lg75 TaxID=2077102 RepID=UPI000CF713A0|nr:nicotinate-nucleotide adenylyltransferase [Pseudoalteromonas sp. T1lg75]
MLLFGGTFDPVHFAHLNMAEQCLEHFGGDTLFFMPNRVPAHKQASGIDNADKLAMLKLATAAEPRFAIDERELHRSGPSYSLLSLQELRSELDASGRQQEPILFLLGMDSFNGFDSWYQWRDILELCHLVVYQRPDERLSPSPQLQAYLNQHQCNQGAGLESKQAGLVYFLAGPQRAVSSTLVRERLQRGEPCEDLIPAAVSQYIRDKHLYMAS